MACKPENIEVNLIDTGLDGLNPQGVVLIRCDDCGWKDKTTKIGVKPLVERHVRRSIPLFSWEHNNYEF